MKCALLRYRYRVLSFDKLHSSVTTTIKIENISNTPESSPLKSILFFHLQSYIYCPSFAFPRMKCKWNLQYVAFCI